MDSGIVPFSDLMEIPLRQLNINLHVVSKSLLMSVAYAGGGGAPPRKEKKKRKKGRKRRRKGKKERKRKKKEG